jgi:tRNA pseudouridine55 synthase
MSATSTDGVLLLDKPAGVSSHDVVAVARRALGGAKVGHAGTLDPFATGLLVLLVGRATRLAPYLPGEPKVYEALIAFGAETDTDDCTGATVRESSPPTLEAIAAALPLLTGDIRQLPPAYSAKQVDGKRAYAAARRGRPLELAPVTVRVDAWESTGYDNGMLRVVITCGSGTYIRALARDLGRLTQSAAHLALLRRVRSGPFEVRDAVDWDALRSGRARIISPLASLVGLPHEVLDDAGMEAVRHGRAVGAHVEGSRAALVAPDGTLAAIGHRSDDGWQPRVVLANA